MARRLILDTGVLVAAERERIAAGIREDDDVVIAAVTLAELYTGVDLASDARRASRLLNVNRVLETVPIVAYDDDVAFAHGSLLAHVHRTGRPRSAHDLIIAATAVATGRLLLTTDRAARFGELPGVQVEVLG
ncbi:MULTISPECIES: PIN domain-containing protein [Microbacterium]|uniref:Ribonuclease VapC n=1 Tax=Microbacterium profundi TaxID=450380 RepID=A0ABV3LE19_9MICO|nr:MULTISPECIES: PIN domain-containing protein [Microbacterium]MCE7483250.1 PIN domain-containing protein [Microbacterium profundi]